jgi:hypothetical protein
MVHMQSNPQGTTLVSPGMDSIGNSQGNGEREQSPGIIRTSAAPRSSSMNWLSQLANSTSANTDGHKAKTSSKKQGMHGMSDEAQS